MESKARNVSNAIGLVLLLAATVAADPEVWRSSELQEVFPLGGKGGLRLVTMSSFMGWGQYNWLALAAERSATLPDSFCVHGDALVSPADLSDTLEPGGRVQVLSQGPMVRLDTALSRPPDTVVLQLICHPFGSEPDSGMAVWVLEPGIYRRIPPHIAEHLFHLNGD